MAQVIWKTLDRRDTVNKLVAKFERKADRSSPATPCCIVLLLRNLLLTDTTTVVLRTKSFTGGRRRRRRIKVYSKPTKLVEQGLQPQPEWPKITQTILWIVVLVIVVHAAANF